MFRMIRELRPPWAVFRTEENAKSVSGDKGWTDPRAPWLDLLRVFARSSLLQPSCCIRFKDPANFVPNAAKHSHLCFLRTCDVGGVIKAPMVTIGLSWKDGASLVSISTHRDD